MTNYTQTTDFSAKDGLTTGDPEKAISGADVDGEFSDISTAIASKIDEPGSPVDGDYLRWDGGAWAAEDPGADGTAGQVYRTDGTNATFGSAVSQSSVIDLTNGGSNDTADWLVSSIPAWVTNIRISFIGASGGGTGDPMVQLGDSGGLEESGYTSSVTDANGVTANDTNGFGLYRASAASAVHGVMTLVKASDASESWCHSCVLATASGSCNYSAGSKTLTGTLDRVNITFDDGTTTFDGGTAHVVYW